MCALILPDTGGPDNGWWLALLLVGAPLAGVVGWLAAVAQRVAL